MLTKVSATDYNTTWQTPTGGGGLTLPLSQNLTWTTDNTYDIGTVGPSGRPRTLIVGTSISTPVVGNPQLGAPLSFQTQGSTKWQIDSSGMFLAATDNAYDIGASGANRPRDLYLGRNLTVGGTLGVTGAASFSSTVLLAADPTLNLQAATKQYADTKLTQAQGDARYQTPAQAAALYLPLSGGTLTGNLLFSTDNTRDIGASGATRPRDLYLGRNALVAGTLSLGSTPATLSANGGDVQSGGALIAGNGYLFIGSQKDVMWTRQGPNDLALVGRAGIDNLWAKTNLSIGVAPVAGKQLVIGSSGEYIRNPVNALANLSIESSDGWAAMGGKAGGFVLGNAYNDGTNWQRFDVASPAALVTLNSSGINFYNAPAAANPISWSTSATIDTAGKLTLWGGLNVNSGPVVLPGNSINNYLGGYVANPTWSTTTNSAWVETPIQITVTCSGARVRVSGLTSLLHSVAGAGVYLGLGIDGAPVSTLATINFAAASSYVFVPYTLYWTPTAGAHRFSFFVYNTSGGTLSVESASASRLDVVEERA